MKKMISKITLAILVISATPMHAGLGQLVQNGARTVLQGAGNNAGRIAVAAGGLVATCYLFMRYKLYSDDAEILKYNQKHEKKREARMISEGRASEYSPIKLTELERKQKLRRIWGLPHSLAVGAIASGIVYGLSKACGWVGSKI
jgi:hypothetical protein